ncbi:PREDICTED: uncharacterized protein LOC104742375 [Camelina sativa]|uniref:Uncharacterized protein LOC104742375 n=1 Tax=Camelina sativa TaxID=90675 RepID=A0ABM0VVH2_CAMSA|nr:PREDICTED: uncharacterized protein LOC104742375 [Camelina sativa]
MWERGELVWVNLSLSDTWIPGRILNSSVPVGILVSFFGLIEPRYVPKPCLRSFDRNFEALVSDSRRFRRFVNRALRAHFWNISFGLWCPCQPLIESPYFDSESSLSWFPNSSDSALCFVRDMAVSIQVPLRSLANTNSSSAQILSFRRYAVDFKRSASVYEEIRASARLMDRSEESDWYLDPSNTMYCVDLDYMFPTTWDADVENSSDLSPLPKDIHCYSSDQSVDNSYSSTWNTRNPRISSCSSTWNTRNPRINSYSSTWNTRNPDSYSSTMRACETMARTAVHEDDGHQSKSRGCQVEQSVCLLNSEPAVEDMIEEDTNNTARPRVDVSEEPSDVMIGTHDDIIGLVDTTVTSVKQTTRTAVHEDDGHRSKSRGCQVEHSVCLLNSEPSVEDMIEEDNTNTARPKVDVSEEPSDLMIETHDDIIGLVDTTVTSAKQLSPLLDASNDKAYLAKPVSFVVPGACHTLACSMRKTYANPRDKLDSSILSAKSINEQSLGRKSFNGTQGNWSDDAFESHIVEVGQTSRHISGTSNKEFSSDDAGIAPAEQLQDLDAARTVESQMRSVDNVRSIGVKRKASRNKASARNSMRKKRAAQQSISTDKTLNLHLMKDMRLANPKCLRMKFLSRHGDIPSKSEVLKRFSVFGKIDASRTDVSPEKSSAKVVFMQSIDAVTAYQFARTKKFRLGRCKVTYRLDAFEEDNEVNDVLLSQEAPKSCLKEHGSEDKEEGKRNLKVKFQMEAN